MNKVTINGKTYTAPDGCSINVINNKAYVNGKLLEDFNDWKEKNIEIKVEGNCNEVKADAANITVGGNVEGNVSSDAGNITIRGDIKGDAKTDCGNIKSHHIFGNASTDCGNVNGNMQMTTFGNFSSNIRGYNNTVVSNKKGWFKSLMQDIFD